MYKIIGGDGKEYGPVDAEVLKGWIRDGRLNSRSLVQGEGGPGWKPLSDFAEFATILADMAGPEPTTAAPPVIDAEGLTEQILARPPQLLISRCLSLSAKLLMENFRLLLGASAIVWAIGWCQLAPGINLAYKVGAGVLHAGLYLIFLRRIRGQPASIGDVFDGFKRDFAQLLLAGFISSLLASVGMCFLLVPGIYLLVAWVFSVPLVADRRLQFWSAMELSRKVVTKVWFQVLGLLVLAFLPMILAGLFAGAKLSLFAVSNLGDIITTGPPDIGRLMEVITRMSKTSFDFNVLTRFVLLLNLPFAVGALMYAYEDLFGSRSAPGA